MPVDEVLGVELRILRSDISDMKTSLDRMSDAITKLALVEQQQRYTSEALERAFKSISDLNNKLSGPIEARLSAIEKLLPQHSEVAKWVDRGLVALAGVGVTLLTKGLIP